MLPWSTGGPVFCPSGPFFLWGHRMYRILWKSQWRSRVQRQEPSARARECRCQFSLCVRICTLSLPNESTNNQPCTQNQTEKFRYLEQHAPMPERVNIKLLNECLSDRAKGRSSKYLKTVEALTLVNVLEHCSISWYYDRSRSPNSLLVLKHSKSVYVVLSVVLTFWKSEWWHILYVFAHLIAGSGVVNRFWYH